MPRYSLIPMFPLLVLTTVYCQCLEVPATWTTGEEESPWVPGRLRDGQHKRIPTVFHEPLHSSRKARPDNKGKRREEKTLRILWACLTSQPHKTSRPWTSHHFNTPLFFSFLLLYLLSFRIMKKFFFDYWRTSSFVDHLSFPVNWKPNTWGMSCHWSVVSQEDAGVVLYCFILSILKIRGYSSYIVLCMYEYLCVTYFIGW